MYSASVADNPLVMGGLLLAGFLVLMLLVAIAYFVIKSVMPRLAPTSLVARVEQSAGCVCSGVTIGFSAPRGKSSRVRRVDFFLFGGEQEVGKLNALQWNS